MTTVEVITQNLEVITMFLRRDPRKTCKGTFKICSLLKEII